MPIFAVIQAINFFIVRVGNLIRICADFDFGDNGSVCFFFRTEFINPSKHRLALRCNQAFTNAKSVNLCALVQNITDNILIQRIRNNNLTLTHSRLCKHFTRFFGQIGNVPRIQPNAKRSYPTRKKHLGKCTDCVGNSALQNIICVNQKSRIFRIYLAVGAESFIFTVKHLHP